MPRKAAGTTRKSRTSASRPLRRARSTRRVLNDSAARTLTSLQSDNIQNEKAGEDPERNDDSRGVNDSDPSSGLLSYLHQRRHPSKHGKEDPEADPDQEVHHEEFQVGPEILHGGPPDRGQPLVLPCRVSRGDDAGAGKRAGRTMDRYHSLRGSRHCVRDPRRLFRSGYYPTEAR